MTIACTECGDKENFVDSKSVTFAHWQIIGWNLNDNIPICICKDCERHNPKKKKK